MKTFYLAHNWESRHDVRVIQRYLEKHFNVKFINPFYDTSQKKDMTDADFNDVIAKYYGTGKVVKAHKVDSTMSFKKKKQYRDDDLMAILETDGLVCILLETKRAIGSIKEIFYAHEIAKKPVYLICADKRFTRHMWHDIEVKQTFETVLDFIDFLKEKRWNKR